MTAEELVEKLQYYRNAYYTTGAEISDQEFDLMEDQLRKMDPNNAYFNQVGHKVSEFQGYQQVSHAVPMLSMQKVQDAESARRWMIDLFMKADPLKTNDKLASLNWLIQPKIDGVSCTIHYDIHGRFEYLATRGDGNTGFIVTYGREIMMANDFPLNLYDLNSEDSEKLIGKEIDIRGEFYLPKNVIGVNPPLRNALVGILKRKDLTPDIQKVRICLYGVVDNLAKSYISYGDYIPHSFPKMASVMSYSTLCKVDGIQEVYSQYLDKARAAFPFETDGLVIYYPEPALYSMIDSMYKDNTTHHYTMALKPPAQIGVTKVNNLRINISRFGQLIPVLELDPIVVKNINISHVSMTNWDNMIEKGIKLGSVVRIGLANDVIPYMKEKLSDTTSKEFMIPKTCPSCNSMTAKIGKNYVCTNMFCRGTIATKIEYFFDKLNIKGIGIASIEKCLDDLMRNNIFITSPLEFIQFFLAKIRPTNFPNILGAVTFNKIYDNIMKRFSKITYEDILAYSSFVQSIGLKSFQEYPALKSLDRQSLYLTINHIVTNPNNAWKRNFTEWYQNPNNTMNADKIIELTENIMIEVGLNGF